MCDPKFQGLSKSKKKKQLFQKIKETDFQFKKLQQFHKLTIHEQFIYKSNLLKLEINKYENFMKNSVKQFKKNDNSISKIFQYIVDNKNTAKIVTKKKRIRNNLIMWYSGFFEISRNFKT